MIDLGCSTHIKSKIATVYFENCEQAVPAKLYIYIYMYDIVYAVFKLVSLPVE